MKHAHATSIAFLQGCINDPGYNPAATFSCTFSSPATAGEAIAGSAYSSDDTVHITSIADNASGGSNIYTLVAYVGDSAVEQWAGEGFYATNIHGSPTIITITLSTSTSRQAVIAHEISGVAAVSPLDGYATSTNRSAPQLDVPASRLEIAFCGPLAKVVEEGGKWCRLKWMKVPH